MGGRGERIACHSVATLPMAGIARSLTVVALFCVLALTGCTSRGITVTSNPPGAELSINRRVVGKTPMRLGFTHYGTYRIEMRLKGYEVFVKEEELKPGFYGYDPAAFVADNLVPARLNDEIYLHYVLTKIDQKDDRTALLDRAASARDGESTHPKTGEKTVVDLGREPKKLTSVASEDELVAKSEKTETAPAVVDSEPSRKIDAKKPEGLRIAGEYGLTAEEDKRGSFEKVEGEKKKPDAPKEIRVPKDEELIYDQPEVKDPTVKPAPEGDAKKSDVAPAKAAPDAKPAAKAAPAEKVEPKKAEPAKMTDKEKKAAEKAEKEKQKEKEKQDKQRADDVKKAAEEARKAEEAKKK
jgi:hypothetical protein